MSVQAGDDADEAEEKCICSGCIKDSYLKKVIEAEGNVGECSYCGDEAKTISIEEMANHVDRAFEEHYDRTSTQPDGFESAMLSDRESDYEWERHGEEVLWAIAGAAGIDEDPAQDILDILEERHSDFEADKMGEETEFASDSFYEKKEIRYDELLTEWNQFEVSLKTRSRFFNREAHGILGRLFAGLAALRTARGKTVVVEAGPETEIPALFRARVFAGEDDKLTDALAKPWIGLGPPPMIAAAAGRMNARGISVFYGAVEAQTALAEVRPPVGSQVGVGCFQITRRLRLLDVDALKEVRADGSIFDPDYLPQAQLARFMEILSHRITRPVMPNAEAFEYLTTQAIADYLASEAHLDGIIFPSVQIGHASANVVLFHHASRVESVALPEGTEIDVRLEQFDEDGSSPDYWVLEEVPPPEPELKPKQPMDFWDELLSPMPEPPDPREVSLKMEVEKVVVHHITAVELRSDKYEVRRHRVEKKDPPDY